MRYLHQAAKQEIVITRHGKAAGVFSSRPETLPLLSLSLSLSLSLRLRKAEAEA